MLVNNIYFVGNDQIVDVWKGCAWVEYKKETNTVNCDQGMMVSFGGEVIITEGDPGDLTIEELRLLDVKDECLPPEQKMEQQKQTIQQQEKTITDMQQLLLQLQEEVNQLKQQQPPSM
jgi:hypothetical protein